MALARIDDLIARYPAAAAVIGLESEPLAKLLEAHALRELATANRAEALPAWEACPAIAQADALGRMQPRLATVTNSGSSNGHKACGCSRLTPSKHMPPARYNQITRRSQYPGP